MNAVRMTSSEEQPRRWQPHLAQYDTLLAGLRAVAGSKLFGTWKLIQKPGKAKPDKIPFTRDGRLLTGSFSDPALQAKLMTLAEAIAAAKARGHDGVGLVFSPNCGIVGIDLDTFVVNGKFVGTPKQQQAFKAFEPYAFIELSQSGTGLHAIALGDAATNKKDGELELFGDKNFLALTGLNGYGVAGQIPADEIKMVDELVCQLKGMQRSRRIDPNLNSDLTAHLKGAEGLESFDVVSSALRYLDPAMSRDQWLTVIWAIRHGLGDTPEALDLADLWSKGGLHA